ncbi:DNA/RNA polymerases superfamily protein [Gossypium australe]|uniref:DNA/RNA polymerases superfamily protein n=1 Tax=Gossypium australe TaxID=47621 RepID=A0A5B6WTR7_9ROSI|nr:DNA/RNA polymerases superfamily protein [Gossypium australe]
MFAKLSLFENKGLLVGLQVNLTLLDEIKLKQPLDLSLLPHVKLIEEDKKLRESILLEAYSSPYVMHLRRNKMYRDVCEQYWWPRLKHDVTEFVANGLPLTPSKRDSVWVIVDRLTKSAHFLLVRTNYAVQKLAVLFISEIVRLHGVPISIISDWDPHFTSQFWKKLHKALGTRHLCVGLNWGKRKVLGPDLIQKTDKKGLEFNVDDWVFLKMSPRKKVLSFGHKGKLSLRFIGAYCILKRIGPVAYQLELRSELDHIHDIFHVSILRRYRSDLYHMVSIEEIEVHPYFSFEKDLVQILDRKVNGLRKKRIPLMKVLWWNHGSSEAAWESKDLTRQQYPHLFQSVQPSLPYGEEDSFLFFWPTCHK